MSEETTEVLDTEVGAEAEATTGTKKAPKTVVESRTKSSKKSLIVACSLFSR